jgi:hypothetical protein
VAVEQYWKSINNVHRLTQTAEQLGLAHDWGIDPDLFNRATPPGTEEIGRQMESLKQAVRSFRAELESREQHVAQSEPNETPADPVRRIQVLKAQVALKQARTTLEHFAPTERILDRVSADYSRNASELAAVLGGTARDLTGAQRQPTQNSQSLAEGYSEGQQQILSRESQTLLTTASDLKRIEPLARSPDVNIVEDVRSALNTLERRLDAIGGRNELRQRVEQAPRAAAEQAPGAIDTSEARRGAVAVAASEASETAPPHGVEPVGERGTAVGRLTTGALEHGATVGFGLLAFAQVGDAFLKGDSQAFFQSLESAGLLGIAAGAPWGMEKGLGAWGVSNARAKRAGSCTASGFGAAFLGLSLKAVADANEAYGAAAHKAQTAKEELGKSQTPAKRKELENSLKEATDAMEVSSWAGFSSKWDAGAAGVGAISSIMPSASKLGGLARLTAVVAGAGSLALHAYTWTKGPEGARTAGEWLLKTAGIIGPAEGVDSGQRQSGQQETAAAEQKKALDRLEALKDSSLGLVVV